MHTALPWIINLLLKFLSGFCGLGFGLGFLPPTRTCLLSQAGPYLKAVKAYIYLWILVQKALFKTPDILKFIILLWNRLHISNAEIFFDTTRDGEYLKCSFMKAVTSEGG